MANPEHLKILKQWNKWREEQDVDNWMKEIDLAPPGSTQPDVVFANDLQHRQKVGDAKKVSNRSANVLEL